ncbi:MAG: FHA domain-containing protein [bacterium]|nr:FHA domain-containing protein [bacterium]
MNLLRKISRVVRKLRSLFSKKSEAEDIAFEKIPLFYISEKLINTAKNNQAEKDGGLKLPSGFTVNFSPEDRLLRRSVENILIRELRNILDNEIEKWRGEKYDHAVDITVETDASLIKGEFSINCRHDMRRPGSVHAKKQKKLFKTLRFSRNDLSRTYIPPPGSSRMQDGRLVSSLLNPGGGAEIPDYIQSKLCCLEIKEPGNERKIFLKPGTYSIGRGKKSDIQLNKNDLILSRDHLTLNLCEDGMTVTMNGKNGGKVNSGTVEQGAKCLLISGDKIFIGNTVLTLKKEEVC